MTPSEFAFKSFRYAELSDFNDWALLSPSDWICLLSGAVLHPEMCRRIIDAVCQKYATDLVGAKSIVIYRNSSTSMKVVVEAAVVERGEQHVRLFELEGGVEKRFLHRPVLHCSDKPRIELVSFAGVFVSYDLEGNVVALAVGLEDFVSKDDEMRAATGNP